MRLILITILLLSASILFGQINYSAPVEPDTTYFTVTHDGYRKHISYGEMLLLFASGGGSVGWSGAQNQVAYGDGSGGLTGEVGFEYDPSAKVLKSFNYHTLRLNNMEARVRAGTTAPFSVATASPGSQVANVLSHVNISGAEATRGIIGYRQFSGGANGTAEGWFISSRTPTSGPEYGGHTAFFGYDRIDLNDNRITSLASPTETDDATNKEYVDARGDLVYNAVKPADELLTNNGYAVDGDLDIQNVNAGLYKVDILLKFTGEDDDHEFSWSTFITNYTNSTAGGFRLPADIGQSTRLWNSLNNTTGPNGAQIYQIEIIGGHLRINTNGARVRITRGAEGGETTLMKDSYLRLTRVGD